MAKKSIALGSVVEADFSGAATTYVPIGLTTGFQPPARNGTEADGKTLGSALDVPLPGIEGPGEFTFTQFYDPGDAEQLKVNTAFDNRRDPAGVDGGVVSIRIVYPHEGIEIADIAPVELFDVRILNIGPEAVSEPNSTFKRVVQCRRIDNITRDTVTLAVSGISDPPG